MEATSGSQPENVSSILTGVVGKPFNMILYHFSSAKNTSGSRPGGAAAPAEDRTGPENKWGTYRDHPDGIHMIRKKKCMTGSKY